MMRIAKTHKMRSLLLFAGACAVPFVLKVLASLPLAYEICLVVLGPIVGIVCLLMNRDRKDIAPDVALVIYLIAAMTGLYLCFFLVQSYFPGNLFFDLFGGSAKVDVEDFVNLVYAACALFASLAASNHSERTGKHGRV